jgi:subfamily B ATP-binding cassette protein MsbA
MPISATHPHAARTAPTSPRQMLWRVARKYPWKILLSVSLGFAGGIFNGVGTALIIPILLSLLGQDAILKEGPPILQALLSPFESVPDAYRLIVMAIAALTVIILKSITNYLSGLSSSILSRSLTADLQERGLATILDVDMAFFSSAKVGELMNRLGGEMGRAISAITVTIRLCIVVVTILIFLGILLSISWQLTLVMTALLPISSIISQFISQRAKVFSRALTQLNGQYSGGLVELLSGIRLVKATANEKREYERFVNFIRQREKLNLQAQMNSSLIGPLAEVVNTSILFALVFVSRALFQNQLEVLSAIMVTYLVLLSRLLPYIGQLNSARNQLAKVSASIDIVYDLLRRDNKGFMQNGALRFQGLQQGIKFKGVSFTYPGSEDQVLANITLNLPKGTTLALVGSSGAGKSTLADLLPRFFDPTQGSIQIDGEDLRHYDIATIRKAMGVVSQDTFLFNNTVRYNIAYGRLEATDEEIISAAKRANAYGFIMQLPQGLDTMIGDRGIMLSGGQRQRLAIARALLQNPEILVLDEATSALDTVSERLVQQALDELSRDRTTLVIAHRLSTVQNADQIAVMDKGRVAELGTHQDLLIKGGLYSKLCSLQFDTGSEHNPVYDLAEQQRMMAQISYEFRANLNAMVGFLTLLSEDLVETEEERQEVTDKISQSTQNLLRGLERMEMNQEKAQQLLKSSASTPV